MFHMMLESEYVTIGQKKEDRGGGGCFVFLDTIVKDAGGCKRCSDIQRHASDLACDSPAWMLARGLAFQKAKRRSQGKDAAAAGLDSGSGLYLSDRVSHRLRRVFSPLGSAAASVRSDSAGV